ncbi:MAG TPA: alpha/beta fold hydrolase [Chryseolinea sp.]|nr:alpha/beta fold hydrolase [Chryseolinea sp.]
MKLFSREYGDGAPLIILHGLLGSSDNWLTQGKLLSPQFKIYAIDQRNHGQSPHDDAFDYQSMVTDLLEFLDANDLRDPVLIGHSMGGKTVMNFALQHPDRVNKLVVVDIAPRAYNLEHYALVNAMAELPLSELKSRNDADTLLAAKVAEPDVRQFLLKNLQRTAEGGFSWKVNLPVIREKLSNVGIDLLTSGTFDKPTLFIKGARSQYIKDTDWERIKTRFPAASLETLETGHWVQAEKPQEFVDLLVNWLQTH